MSDDPKLGGTLEDIEHFLAHDALPIVEVALPIIAPWSAPIVAAEHALRNKLEVSFGDAKKATTAATAIGKAVADSQKEAPKESTTSSDLQTSSSSQAATVKRSSSSATLWIAGALIALLMFRR